MKNLLLILSLFISSYTFAQYPTTQTLGSDSSIVKVKGGFWANKGIVNGYYIDTFAANITRIAQYPFAQIITDTGTFRIRNSAATGWNLIQGTAGIITIDTTKAGQGIFIVDKVLSGSIYDSILNTFPDTSYVTPSGDTLLFHNPYPFEQEYGYTFTGTLGGVGAFIDSLRRQAGSTNVEAKKNGVWTVQYIDSTGGAGGGGLLHAVAGTGLLQLNDSTIINKFRDTTTGGYYPYGRIGIGVLNPAYKLDVKGDINVSADSAYKYNGIDVIKYKLFSYFFGGGNITLTGTHNVTVGNGGGSLTTGYRNVIIGATTGLSLSTGAQNTFVGYSVNPFGQGDGNTIVGGAGLASNTTGSNNSSLGGSTLQLNTTGSKNTAIGSAAQFYNETGYGNTAVGALSLQLNTTGSYNVVIGDSALVDLDITANNGSGNNTVVGTKTGLGIVTGVNNTIIGANVTGLSSSLSNNIILADGAGTIRVQINSSGIMNLGTKPDYANNAAALSGGLVAGDVYRNGDILMIVH